jgi:hypothetical protein
MSSATGPGFSHNFLLGSSLQQKKHERELRLRPFKGLVHSSCSRENLNLTLDWRKNIHWCDPCLGFFLHTCLYGYLLVVPSREADMHPCSFFVVLPWPVSHQDRAKAIYIQLACERMRTYYSFPVTARPVWNQQTEVIVGCAASEI